MAITSIAAERFGLQASLRRHWLCLSMILLCSCTSRYFPTEDAVFKHLSQHEDEFGDIAEEWNAAHDGYAVFAYFRAGSYRWGEQFISAGSAGYTVGRGAADSALVSDLAEAARVAGTTYDELTRWIDVAQRLRIYSISKSYAGDAIEIKLWGSEWLPYGLRYAPEGQDDLYSTLMLAVGRRRSDASDVKFVHLKGRWFHFEAERF